MLAHTQHNDTYSGHNTMPAGARIGAAVLVLTSVASAGISKRHVQLVTPQPFDWDEYGPTNPLAPDGSDYPCKVKQGDTFRVDGAPTEMAIGEEQEISFSGWAVHGGGSCQFALTEGLSPTKDTAWKVIHSIEGGCPKANVTGNLEPGQDPDTYTFRVPDDFEPGNYTFAWTWVNRIAGSPEFYMNCAPIAVTAAAGSTRRVQERRDAQPGRRATTYPDLFLANIGDASNGCTTSEAVEAQIAIEFPYPGDSVAYPNGMSNLYQQSCDGNTRNTGTTASGGSQPSGTTGSSVGASRTATATRPSLELSSTSSVVSTTVASASSIPPYYTTLDTSQASPSQTVVASTSSTSTAAASTGTSTLDSPCTDGHLLCVDGTQFSTCTGGTWDTPQSLALNTTCVEEGESVGLDTTYHWD